MARSSEPGVGQLDQRLEQAGEEGVALQAAVVEIVVDARLFAGAPRVHQPVRLVDQRRGAAVGRGVAE